MRRVHVGNHESLKILGDHRPLAWSLYGLRQLGLLLIFLLLSLWLTFKGPAPRNALFTQAGGIMNAEAAAHTLIQALHNGKLGELLEVVRAVPLAPEMTLRTW